MAAIIAENRPLPPNVTATFLSRRRRSKKRKFKLVYLYKLTTVSVKCKWILIAHEHSKRLEALPLNDIVSLLI